MFFGCIEEPKDGYIRPKLVGSKSYRIPGKLSAGTSDRARRERDILGMDGLNSCAFNSADGGANF